MLLLTTTLAKSMFKVNKSLLIPQQIMHVMWQNIPRQGVEYFATSYIISMWHMNILGIFHDLTWNIP